MNAPANNDDGVTVEITNRMPDTARQSDERTALAETRQINSYAGLLGAALATHIKKNVAKIDRVDILETKANLKTNDAGKYDGTVEYAIRVLHAGKTKETPITIVCSNSDNEMPSTDALNAELDKVKANEDKKADEIKAAADAENKIMAELASELIQKEASAGPVAGSVLAPVLHVDKTWLPASLKAGDAISVDGVRYTITGDDHNKLSAASDGSFWTLRILDEVASANASTIKTKHMLI